MVSKQARINQAMRLLSNSYRPLKNAVRISKANTFEHEQAKFLKCWELLQDNKCFYTEAIFANGGRADIFCPQDFAVFEILHSETKKEALKKIEKYPDELEVFLINSHDILEEYEVKK